MNYANKPWPPPKVRDYLPCECIEVRNPPGQRCTRNWTRCVKRMTAIREWQAQQPDKPQPPASDDRGGGRENRHGHG